MDGKAKRRTSFHEVIRLLTWIEKMKNSFEPDAKPYLSAVYRLVTIIEDLPVVNVIVRLDPLQGSGLF